MEMRTDEIIVRTQKEWNDIPKEFDGYISIQDADIIVAEMKGSRVEAKGNASVVAWNNVFIIARDHASVEARNHASVEAWDNASVIACENSSVMAVDNSSVIARNNSFVETWGNAFIEAKGNAFVVARGNASVEARDNVSVDAGSGSSVIAWNNVSIVAEGRASIEAWDNVSVVAWGESSVVARGNVQVVKYSDRTNLEIQGNARIVTPPDTVQEYCEFYGIEIKDNQAMLYKAVKPDYSTFYDSEFKYRIGKTFTNSCNNSRDVQCSFGLHVSHINWALEFGRSKDIDDFVVLECAVPVDKIIVPKNTDGKIRTSELTVLREVPLEECGVMGKIILKQREKSLRDRLCAP